MKKCEETYCEKTIYAKGNCTYHYMRKREESFKKNDPEKYEEMNRKRNLKRLERYKKRYHTDKEFRERERAHHRKFSKEYARRKALEDPEWNARKQREYRKKHPESFNLLMVRYYFRRMSPLMRALFIKEIKEEIRMRLDEDW